MRTADIKYEVINDYPFNKHFKVGDILDMDRHQSGELWYHLERNLEGIVVHQNFQDVFFNQYPHIFKQITPKGS